MKDFEYLDDCLVYHSNNWVLCKMQELHLYDNLEEIVFMHCRIYKFPILSTSVKSIKFLGCAIECALTLPPKLESFRCVRTNIMEIIDLPLSVTLCEFENNETLQMLPECIPALKNASYIDCPLLKTLPVSMQRLDSITIMGCGKVIEQTKTSEKQIIHKMTLKIAKTNFFTAMICMDIKFPRVKIYKDLMCIIFKEISNME